MSGHFEKQLKSETRFEGRIFSVTVDDVQLEDGGLSKREIVHHHGGACILRYAGDVAEGAVPFETVADALRVNYAAEIRSSLYNATVLQWMDEANIQYHLDTF